MQDYEKQILEEHLAYIDALWDGTPEDVRTELFRGLRNEWRERRDMLINTLRLYVCESDSMVMQER